MITNNRRAHNRLRCTKPVVILREKTLRPSSVLMKNFSEGGVGFEVSDPLASGDYIVIIPDTSQASEPTATDAGVKLKAKVKWCMEMGTGNSRRYGCGVEYV